MWWGVQFSPECLIVLTYGVYWSVMRCAWMWWGVQFSQECFIVLTHGVYWSVMRGVWVLCGVMLCQYFCLGGSVLWCTDSAGVRHFVIPHGMQYI